MRKLFFIISLLVCIPVIAGADTIVFKDGTSIDVPRAWEENGEIKCKVAGVVIGYPKKEIKRIIRQKQSVFPRKLSASEVEELARMQPGSCYDLGKRYGYCTTLNLYGDECPPQDDIRLPPWCRRQDDTEKGMLDGIRLAYKSLDLPPTRDAAFAAQNSSACFELGKQYGKCATLSMYNKTCDPKDDIVMPLDCRGKADTKSGMRVGVRAAFQSMGLPTK
jgi:hypothetical protein